MSSFSEDYVAIRQVLARYCRGIDRLDADLLRSAYWEDAIDNHGVYEGLASGFVDFIMPHMTRSYTATHHFLGQSLVEIQGDQATSETYVRADHFQRPPRQAELRVTTGRYVDRLERRGGAWRISERVVVLDWVTNVPLLGEAVPWPVAGARSREDHSYGVLPG